MDRLFHRDTPFHGRLGDLRRGFNCVGRTWENRVYTVVHGLNHATAIMCNNTGHVLQVPQYLSAGGLFGKGRVKLHCICNLTAQKRNRRQTYHLTRR